jgi:hypothetical protein
MPTTLTTPQQRQERTDAADAPAPAAAAAADDDTDDDEHAPAAAAAANEASQQHEAQLDALPSSTTTDHPHSTRALAGSKRTRSRHGQSDGEDEPERDRAGGRGGAVAAADACDAPSTNTNNNSSSTTGTSNEDGDSGEWDSGDGSTRDGSDSDSDSDGTRRVRLRRKPKRKQRPVVAAAEAAGPTGGGGGGGGGGGVVFANVGWDNVIALVTDRLLSYTSCARTFGARVADAGGALELDLPGPDAVGAYGVGWVAQLFCSVWRDLRAHLEPGGGSEDNGYVSRYHRVMQIGLGPWFTTVLVILHDSNSSSSSGGAAARARSQGQDACRAMAADVAYDRPVAVVWLDPSPDWRARVPTCCRGPPFRLRLGDSSRLVGHGDAMVLHASASLPSAAAASASAAALLGQMVVEPPDQGGRLVELRCYHSKSVSRWCARRTSAEVHAQVARSLAQGAEGAAERRPAPTTS